MNLRVYYEYFSSHIASKWIVLLIDVIVVATAMLSAYVLQFQISYILYKTSLYVWMLVFSLLSNIFFFHILQTYVGVIRFSSFVDIYRVFLSLTLSYGILGIGNFCWSILSSVETLPSSILFIAYVFTFFFMVCLRIGAKMLYEIIAFDVRHSVNVFIYGSHGAGVNVAKSLRVSQNNRFRLRGFISDEPDMIGKHTMGCRVYANDNELLDCIKEKNVHAVIVSPEKIVDLETSGILNRLFSNGIKVMMVPPLSDCMDGELIKDIQIEDWLRKEPIQINNREIASHVEGGRIMIIGAAGVIGRGIVRQLASLNPYLLILVDQAESPLYDVQLELSDYWKNLNVRVLVADITNRTRMEAIFKETQPQLVFHVAAYKQPQLMEDYVSESLQVNVLGTMNIADLVVQYNVCRMVLISTDKAIHPVWAVEYTKRLSEIYVQALGQKLQYTDELMGSQLVIVRFGDIDPNGLHGLITLSEVSMLVLEAGVMGGNGEIYVLEEKDKALSMSAHYKKIKQEISSLCDYGRIRESLSVLIKYSYTEKTAILLNEMKKIISDLDISSITLKDMT
ncbi:polysaccharide biosynthesis protein [Bacteroides helcogenes]|uniref:Polysaccharide biosynthesis protein CapD n=1 Tax=Bacteroides helcogenes (strain ATCC 35417 / DSM 20613 / JCM 6297 / CCUG 15421 / P 36-108) TaxID=693979 RepID=E6SN91_BACT6|nr:polysaccharide biosynthesis protein [Bacteroides helcogenes]ADV44744.1 polysaccharide biosynthesis protein CapD [Bacteroides helcogenes P 36-108]MDY5238495.1 polysaccharide biosynthesis protein [Bacteroides helcogenes]